MSDGADHNPTAATAGFEGGGKPETERIGETAKADADHAPQAGADVIEFPDPQRAEPLPQQDAAAQPAGPPPQQAPNPDPGQTRTEQVVCGRPTSSFTGVAECQVCGTLFDSADVVFLKDLQRGRSDKLGNTVLQVLWATSDYKVYRTDYGVFVQFSDCREVEQKQRQNYGAIFSKVCELRQLCQLTFRVARFRRRASTQQTPAAATVPPLSYADQQTADAIIQAMNGNPLGASEILNDAIELATERVTNENRMRYMGACIAVAVLFCVALLAFMVAASVFGFAGWRTYLTAAVFGAIGAVFSTAISVRSSELVPSRHSIMNYGIGALRVFIGVIGAGALVLALRSGLIGDLASQVTIGSLGADGTSSNMLARAGMLGFLAGFAERLVPDMFASAVNRTGAPRVVPVQPITSLESSSAVAAQSTGGVGQARTDTGEMRAGRSG